MELKTREEFKQLSVDNQVEYYNYLRDEGVSVTKIYKELGVSRSRTKDSFLNAGYVLRDNDKKFTKPGLESEITITKKVEKIDGSKSEESKEKPGTNVLNEVKELRHIINLQQKRLSELEKKVDGIRYAKFTSKDINFKAQDDDEVKPKTFRVYKSALNRLDDFISNCDKVKVQDIVSNAIIQYIEKIEQEK